MLVQGSACACSCSLTSHESKALSRKKLGREQVILKARNEQRKNHKLRNYKAALKTKKAANRMQRERGKKQVQREQKEQAGFSLPWDRTGPFLIAMQV